MYIYVHHDIIRFFFVNFKQMSMRKSCVDNYYVFNPTQKKK